MTNPKRGPGRPPSNPRALALAEKRKLRGEGYDPNKKQKLQLSQRDEKQFKDEGKVLRWFNDVDGRIHEAMLGGWEFVQPSQVPSVTGTLSGEGEDVGSRVSKVVSKGERVIRAYLMWLYEELYREDQEAKADSIIGLENERRPVKQGGLTIEGGYTPD